MISDSVCDWAMSELLEYPDHPETVFAIERQSGDVDVVHRDGCQTRLDLATFHRRYVLLDMGFYERKSERSEDVSLEVT